MQKFILFKDGKPHKGFYCEIDLMNEYSREFDSILDYVWSTKDQKIKAIRESGKAEEYAVYRFFKRIQPAKYVKRLRGYRSVMKEYVKGENENEAGIVCNLDYDSLSKKNKADFLKFSNRFKNRLERLSIDNYDFEPKLKASHNSALDD